MIYQFCIINDNEALTTAFYQKFFFEHGSTTSLNQTFLRIYFISTIKNPVWTLIPKGRLWYTQLYAGHGNFCRGRDNFYV